MSKKVDNNGFWEFGDTLLSREGVFPYLGKQIDQQGRFGLKPNEIYNVYRPRTEVCSKEFIDSLQNLPLVNDHTMIGEDFTPAEKKGIEGVMFNVHIDEKTNNTLRGSIKVFTERVKNLISKMQKRELSLGYICGYRRENGMYDGVPYDFVQYGLKANHIALVDNARMGSDCRVMDSAMCFDSLEMPEMPEEKKSCADALIEQLKNCSEEDKAKVKDFLVGNPKEEQKPEGDAEPKDVPKEEKTEPVKDAEPPKTEEKKEETEPAKDAEPPKEEKKDDEPKKEDEPAKDACPATSCDESIRKAVAEEYGKAVALANRCKDAGFTISMDGLYTEKDVAVKVCAMDGVKLDVPEDGAIAAIKGFLAGRGKRDEKFVTTDSAVKQTKKFDFLATYKGE